MRGAMQVVPELVERNFGELELQQDSNYQKVWDADSASLSSAPAGGVESVTQVRWCDCEPEHLMFSLGTRVQASLLQRNQHWPCFIGKLRQHWLTKDCRHQSMHSNVSSTGV